MSSVIEIQTSAPGKQAQRNLRQQTITVGPHELRINATMSMLADQEAIYFDVKEDPSLVGARPGQELGDLHETLISFYALVYEDAQAAGLTPYSMSRLIPFQQMTQIVGEMNALIGQMPGAEEGNG